MGTSEQVRSSPRISTGGLFFASSAASRGRNSLATAAWTNSDSAALQTPMRWHFEFKVIGRRPIGEDVRVSGVFRNTKEGWRFIHYAESPKTASVYLQELMEKEVRPGWDEFFEQAKKNKAEVTKRKLQGAR